MTHTAICVKQILSAWYQLLGSISRNNPVSPTLSTICVTTKSPVVAICSIHQDCTNNVATRSCLGGQVCSALAFSRGVWSVTAVWTEQGASSQEQGARGGALGPPHHSKQWLEKGKSDADPFLWPKNLRGVDPKKQLICCFYNFTAGWFYCLEWLVFI